MLLSRAIGAAVHKMAIGTRSGFSREIAVQTLSFELIISSFTFIPHLSS
ncbi:MAG: hypothetical protein ACFFDN_10005 [Candidatus Hodarchaeota archaeon]